MPSCKAAIINGQCLLDVHVALPTETFNLSDKTKFKAVIDTGARQTGISQKLVDALSVPIAGHSAITAIYDTYDAPYYHVHVILTILRDQNNGEKQDLMLKTFQSLPVFGFSQAHKEFDVLLGMDVLAECDFSMHHNEFFILGF